MPINADGNYYETVCDYCGKEKLISDLSVFFRRGAVAFLCKECNGLPRQEILRKAIFTPGPKTPNYNNRMSDTEVVLSV